MKNKKTLNHNSLDKIKLNNVKAEIDVGLIGAVICIKYFGPLIAKRKNGGVIINIGSDLSVISLIKIFIIKGNTNQLHTQL